MSLRSPKLRKLYVDNYRGFSDTYIEFGDVNFFVGENSSGKTSILSLIKLLSSTPFWFEQNFAGDATYIGNLDDIVSAHAKDRSYFRVGLIYERAGKTSQQTVACLFTFRDRNGVPQLTDYTSASDDGETAYRLKQRTLFYRISEQPSDACLIAHETELFPRWRHEHDSNSLPFRKLPLAYVHEGLSAFIPIPIPLLPSYVFRDLNEQKLSTSRTNRPKNNFLLPDFGGEMVWIAPIRTKPKRTYDEVSMEFSPEGGHTPYLIRRLLDSKAEADQFKKYMEEIGRSTGLFESVIIKRFGRGKAAPFEVDVIIDNRALGISNVGYGVSQSLPVFVEVIARPQGSWFAIQQPEVHLHPRAQAALGDIFFQMATKENKGFLIETHSDFLIDRFRLNLRRKSHQAVPNSRILFFHRKQQRNLVSMIPIQENGDLSSDQPDEYRGFFVKEQLRVLAF